MEFTRNGIEANSAGRLMKMISGSDDRLLRISALRPLGWRRGLNSILKLRSGNSAINICWISFGYELASSTPYPAAMHCPKKSILIALRVLLRMAIFSHDVGEILLHSAKRVRRVNQ